MFSHTKLQPQKLSAFSLHFINLKFLCCCVFDGSFSCKQWQLVFLHCSSGTCPKSYYIEKVEEVCPTSSRGVFWDSVGYIGQFDLNMVFVEQMLVIVLFIAFISRLKDLKYGRTFAIH